jgi:hypothetical protein
MEWIVPPRGTGMDCVPAGLEPSPPRYFNMAWASPGNAGFGAVTQEVKTRVDPTVVTEPDGRSSAVFLTRARPRSNCSFRIGANVEAASIIALWRNWLA